MVTGLPGNFAEHSLDLYLENYTRGITAAGGVPVNIPIASNLDQLAPSLDGIILSGGADVNPSSYNEPAHPAALPYEEERDQLEFGLLEKANELEIPVLGICRGLQVMNVAMGGTLHQDVPPHSRYDIPTDETCHSVRFDEGSRLHSMFGSTVEVNSLHHQTIANLADGITATAFADDDQIEGIEINENMIAVQWHPELLATQSEDPLFAWLVERARARKSQTQ